MILFYLEQRLIINSLKINFNFIMILFYFRSKVIKRTPVDQFQFHYDLILFVIIVSMKLYIPL